jgi:chromosome segregation ATPase
MTENNLEIRVDNLEAAYARLAGLPGRVTELSVQILQLRDEMRVGFSDVRSELSGGLVHVHQEMGSLRTELRGEIGELRGDVGALRGEVGELRGDMGELRGDVGTLKRETTLIRDDMAAMHKELAGAIVATGNEMRVLHEDVTSRITQLGDLLKPRDST